MANTNCTASVKQLLENVKGTPYGVEVRRSKKGKPQAISFNETVDSFKDVIEDDCSNADRHGRFADTPASEGGAVAACEQYEAEKAPCFSVGGRIKSTDVLKKRLAKKYKEKDSYEEYEDNKYKALENGDNDYSLKQKKIKGSKKVIIENSDGKVLFLGEGKELRRVIKDYKESKKMKLIDLIDNINNKGLKMKSSWARRNADRILKEDIEKVNPKLKSGKNRIKSFIPKTNVNKRNIQWNKYVNILAKFAKSSNNEKDFSKKVFAHYEKSNLGMKSIIEDFFGDKDFLNESEVLSYYPRIKEKVTPTKTVKAKKKPNPQKQNSIPSEIFYEKTPDGKCILVLSKIWYNKMYPQYQGKIKEYFRWNPYLKYWKCKKKGAENILVQLGIPERNSEPLKRVTPEKVKPSKPKFALATQERSRGQQEQPGLSFVSRLERLENNEKSFARAILSMKPKIDKIEEDVEVIKQIVEVDHHNKALQGDIF
ncbi:MAG: hypothetical protein KBF93_15350 [Leptospiraceae bacterium]|nr:hypothetical protein [Leptospiraceae bacterium]